MTGIIIAAVSIPISMGYAQIAGLPAVYGLYGSVFPIIIFGLLSTSRQFVFGVDACGAGRSCTGDAWGCAGNGAGDAGCSSDNIFHGAVAAGILPVQGGQACKLHIDSCHGRIHIRNMHHHHAYAGAEALWSRSGNRRAVRACGAHSRDDRRCKCAVNNHGTYGSCGTACFTKINTKVSDGDMRHDSGSVAVLRDRYG